MGLTASNDDDSIARPNQKGGIEMFENLSNEELIDLRITLHDEEQRIKASREQAELTLKHRMEDTGARAIPHPLYNIRLDRGSPKTDIVVIDRIWLLADRYGVPPEEMAKAYIPAHMQEVPARWDRRHLKPLGKYGEDMAQLIEDSAIYGDMVVKIERKKEK